MYVVAPIKTVSEANQRDHWVKRHRRAKRQRRDAALITPRHPLPVVVTLTRIAPRKLDDDNLRGALKAVRDGVTDKLGLTDDSDPRLTWVYRQERGQPKQYGVSIELQAPDDS